MSLRRLWGIVLLVVALGLVGGVSRDARAAFPGHDGRIAFVGIPDIRTIWSVNPDGSKLDSVAGVDDFGFDDDTIRDLSWSPDGRLLAFTSVYDPESDPPANLYITDGKSPYRQVTNLHGIDAGSVAAVSWLPDGSHLMFICQDEDGWGTPDGICEIGADGTGLHVVIPGRFGAFAASADGRIAYADSDGLFVAKANGSNAHRISPTFIAELNWSPDGTRLVGVSGDADQIVEINADGTGLHNITPGDTPSWSPDGAYLLYAKNGLILIANADGSNPRYVRDPASGDPVFGEQPAWGIGNAPLPPGASNPAPPTPPAVAGRPSIAGAAKEGVTLTAAPGTWNGDPPMTFSYAWQRCDAGGANCAFIDSATAAAYTVASGDLGHTLRVDVTAKNAGGSTSSGSDATDVVIAANAAPRITHTHARWAGRSLRLTVTVCDDRSGPIRIEATDVQQHRTRVISTSGAATCGSMSTAWNASGTRQVVVVRAVDEQGARSAAVRLEVAHR